MMIVIVGEKNDPNQRGAGAMKILCRIGLHWKMKILHCLFMDSVTHREVFEAVCPCGLHWMIEDVFGLPLFKVAKGQGGEGR